MHRKLKWAAVTVMYAFFSLRSFVILAQNIDLQIANLYSVCTCPHMDFTENLKGASFRALIYLYDIILQIKS